MAVSQGVTLGYTAGGKRVVARPLNNRSIHEIVMEGGGQMPKELQGVFSGLASCQRAFDNYLIAYQSKPQARRSKKSAELSEDTTV